MNKSLLGGVALSVAIASSALVAGVEINASSTGLAMQGYDPVACFTEGEATRGSYKITALHDDALYRFATEEHKAAFEANPQPTCRPMAAIAHSEPQWASSLTGLRPIGRSSTTSWT